ncbi:hypothetical protein EVAR_48364_1 [Eumeta japonica]|uniref:Uncharacterized protein n=1 Tax=Eumeta variegata TaxID=151549 RepID=A0A4C1WJ59_EUMVA|nr:hypothetical protein EVAR_48364_1 [Eumeta japonica]
MPTLRHPFGNHAPTASHADRPRQTKFSKLQFIGATDNGQPTDRLGGFLVRESRTHPSHAGGVHSMGTARFNGWSEAIAYGVEL